MKSIQIKDEDVSVRTHPTLLIIAKVPSSNPNNEPYNVRYAKHSFYCDCPDFYYRSGFADEEKEIKHKCKHILALEDYLAKQAEIAERAKEIYYEKKYGVIS